MSGVGIIAYYNRRLDFDSVDKGMAVGWLGLGIVAVALFCPDRFSLRSLVVATKGDGRAAYCALAVPLAPLLRRGGCCGRAMTAKAALRRLFPCAVGIVAQSVK
jgi:hypothetical protein